MSSATLVPIAEIRKNSRHQIRVSLNRWKGQDLVDVRVFAVADVGGQWVPTKAGISVRVGSLPEIIQALELALSEARRLGLVR